jgi:DNA-binding CsgD family transcriptional regulator/tetratricopeptide (TPR) repeat protein
LTGRFEELGEALESLRVAPVAGVAIAGAPGVGKTRLARAAIDALREDDVAVEWISATHAAAVVPLSVFAHLVPPPTDRHTEPIDVFRAVVPSLVERAGGRDLVLVVDDCHLLDDASAALLLQLATSRVARLLLTLRSGARVPDALVALWKDRFVNRIELQPLGRADTADLLQGVLGGPVEPTTVERTWRVSGGNVLYVRELVEDLLRTGALRESEGRWRWDGELAPGARLVELVHARLDRLGPGERFGVDLLAVAERLEASMLLELCGTAAMARLEDEGFITVDPDRRRGWAQLVHPLYGDVLRATMARARWVDLCGRLLDAVRTAGARRTGDVLRVVVWAREAGIDPEPAFLVDAAVHANALADRKLAEHLARAALEHGPEPVASLALGEALVSQARYSEAAEVLAGVEGHDDSTRARLAHWLAMAINDGHKDPDGACAALLAAEESVSERRWIDFLRADRGAVLAQSGRDAQAAALTEHLIEDEETDEIVKLRAITPVGWRWIVTGQARRAADAARSLVGAAVGHPAELPRAAAWVFHSRASALLFLGELDELDRLLERLASTPNPEAAPHVSLYRGRVALLRGKAVHAAADLRESLDGLANPSTERVWALALLAEAYAQLGDVVTSDRFRRQVEEGAPDVSTFFTSDVSRAVAWTIAADGELSRARAALLETAERCRAADEPAPEIHALHDALRLGARHEVADRIAELSGPLDGAWAPAFAAHASALIAQDGVALDVVAEELERIGALRHAAEARAEAAVAHLRAGLQARSAASTAISQRLIGECEGSVVPALPVADLTRPELSRREAEIAQLAARGLSNREIAERLFVSVRTVEGHLHRLYAKLGVNDRSELAPFVAMPAEPENA